MDFKELEAAREAYAKKTKKLITIGAVIVGGFFLFSLMAGAGFYSFFSAFFIGFFVIFILLVASIFYTKNEAVAYKKAYKTYFIENNLKKVFSDLQYNHAMGLSPEVLRSTGMINLGDRYSSNDFISGKYKEVAFHQADVHIQTEHTDSDGNTTYVTIFKGRWMVFEFPKKFNFRLEVVQKHFGSNLIPKNNSKTGRKIEKISTESTTFNQKFKVYAEDGFEAYYILDPAIIDQIEKLSDSYKGKILLCFIDNKLHVGVYDNHDAFEPPSHLKKIDENAEMQEVNQEIKTITDFVEFLKLDRKLFKD